MPDMTIDDLIDKLKTNRLLRTEEEAKAFDEGLAALAQRSKSELKQHLPNILLVFDDAAEHVEVMWGLLHFVEDFGIEEYLRAIGEAEPELSNRASDWVDTFIVRILNSDEHHPVLREVLPTLPEAGRRSIHQILSARAAESDKRKEQVNEVLG